MTSYKRTKPAIMLQATSSNAGKSMLVAGLCRLFTNQGFTVRPFKPQNMSNNAAVTNDDPPGEIGRAQALQAMACKTNPTIHMNPLLLKPEGERGAQLVAQGKAIGRFSAKDYTKKKPDLLPLLIESYQKLEQEADLIIIEGAGSASEVNLRENDLANMGFAEALDLPVILIGDIDQGGVIASLVGTKYVVTPNDQNRIKAFLINKFRGDPALFTPALKTITKQTSWPSLGVLPWFEKAYQLPGEDSQDIASKLKNTTTKQTSIQIAVPQLPRMANFDDLDPLRLHSAIDLKLITPGTALPLDADLIILPGSKATISDLKFLKVQGWDIDLKAYHRAGGKILGLCGGYQMLGQIIEDSGGIEGAPQTIKGLELLNVTTHMTDRKKLGLIEAHFQAGTKEVPLTAYEIHMGRTKGTDCQASPFSINKEKHGALSKDGRVLGLYLHGLFASKDFTDDFIKSFLQKSTEQKAIDHDQIIHKTLDLLAKHMEQHLDMNVIKELAGL